MSRAPSPNGRVLRHPGDLQWLQRRRLQAADLFALGKSRAEIAGELGVSAQTASRWFARWRDGGVAGMRTARQASRPSLAPPSWAQSRRVLDRGAVAGFDNDLWTLARVAEVIERVTGWRTIPVGQPRRPSRHGMVRTEIRLTHGDSHLGHVVADGLVEEGGPRHCINPAALAWCLTEDLEAEGAGSTRGCLPQPRRRRERKR